MSRLQKTFSDLKSQGRKALMTFTVAGDPDIPASLATMKALPAAGVDIIELGMPFTDPMADGAAIQAANLRALAQGITLAKTLDMVRSFREGNATTPVVLMGYFNPVYSYGTDKFAADAANAGVDGLIIVDVPSEEDGELRTAVDAAGLDLIRLVTPTTTPERLQTVIRHASGFLYYVSVAGTTGAKSASPEDVARQVAMIRQHTSLPVTVGFGIRTPDDVRAMKDAGDAVVVGSALVERLGKGENIIPVVTELATALQPVPQVA